MLSFVFMAWTPVERGDLLKTSPVAEDVHFNQMDVTIDLQIENPWVMTCYNIPIEPGYTVSALSAGNYKTTIQEGAVLNYCTTMSDNIAESRYRQEQNLFVYTYNNTGYPIDESDNFTRWLTYRPSEVQPPHNMI